MNINGVEIQIKKSWYNKSQVKEDGITHIIDTSKQYPVYQFGMAKNYFMEDRIAVVDALISDLQVVIQHLEQMREKELGEKELNL